MKTQRSFRLRPDEDAALEKRIGEMAQHGQQGDVIRLALYRLFRLELPLSLRGVAGLFDDDGVSPAPALDNPALMDRVVTVLEKLEARPAPPSRVIQSDQTGEVESVGIDMDRPRPKERRGHEITRRLPPPDRTKLPMS